MTKPIAHLNLTEHINLATSITEGLILNCGFNKHRYKSTDCDCKTNRYLICQEYKLLVVLNATQTLIKETTND